MKRIFVIFHLRDYTKTIIHLRLVIIVIEGLKNLARPPRIMKTFNMTSLLIKMSITLYLNSIKSKTFTSTNGNKERKEG